MNGTKRQGTKRPFQGTKRPFQRETMEGTKINEEVCSSSSECKSGRCNFGRFTSRRCKRIGCKGKCATRLEVGERCGESNDCLSGVCKGRFRFGLYKRVCSADQAITKKPWYLQR